uniref:Conserved oligomeric Golgi complex subunit 6 n=2 Tax=Lepeophtheirus salmonis TaxID=72036 RepID=A0A0K2UCR5_LEPSM
MSNIEVPKSLETPAPTVLERKLRKIIDSGVENDPKVGCALTELSMFFNDNSLKSRRNLRGEIERRSLGVNSEFVAAFENVKRLADSLANDIGVVDSEISKMEADIIETESKTRDLTNKITNYRKESAGLELKSKILNQFRENFELSDRHTMILSDESSEVNTEFFEGLEQLKKIRKDCEETLLHSGGETSLEIMEKMSSIQEAALQKLYKWTTNALRSKNASDFITLEDKSRPFLSTAMKYLQERPVLFKYVLTEFASFRKSFLVQSFIDALTIGGPGGTPRPIELHAHDPLRYVGDMLAWLHQAAPTENENVRGLLQACDQLDIELSCQEALSTITEGICRPLKTRTEQVILSEAEPVVLFRLANLIRFYSGTFSPVMRSTDSALMSTLNELDTLCFNQFMSVLNSKIATMTTSSSESSSSTQNLSPSQNTLSLMSLLKDILSSSTVIEDQEKQFAQIVDAIVDPLLRSLNASVSGYARTDQDVYMLNCLYQISSTLSLFQFNDAKLKFIESEMNMRLDTLASEQASHLIAYLGIQPICTLLLKWSKKSDTTRTLSQVEGMEPHNLIHFVEKLDEFLVGPDSFLLPQISLLNSSSHRKTINQRPLSVVLASYKQLHEAVTDPKSGYDNPNGILNKTPNQVAILLQM